jgi:hypothetical protein
VFLLLYFSYCHWQPSLLAYPNYKHFSLLIELFSHLPFSGPHLSLIHQCVLEALPPAAFWHWPLCLPLLSLAGNIYGVEIKWAKWSVASLLPHLRPLAATQHWSQIALALMVHSPAPAGRMDTPSPLSMSLFALSSNSC